MRPLSRLDWNLIRSFVAVVDQGSLARAARHLKLAHPTVARHVQQLEDALAMQLFERTASGLALNEAGSRLAEVARRMLDDALAFEAVSDAMKGSAAGKVRITVAEVLADLIPDLLRPLQDFSGEIERQFEILVSGDLLNLLEREADIAVRHVRPEQSDLLCRRAGALPMAAYASRAYVDAQGLPTLANLDGHWFVDGASEQRFALAVERLGQRIPQARVVFRSDSLQTQRMAAVAGWGVVALPVFLAEQTPDLVPVLTDSSEAVHLDLWVVARPSARSQLLLRQVGDLLAEGLRRRFGDDDGVTRTVGPVSTLSA
ncbi:MAG: LysR family transcriptional regulator [Pseudomonadales bacterium]|jgi:DNA-binding transcriptional LysR family regulator|nr:LysR family transcriptional regulator [Pseudomonadales bacterium]